MKKLLLIVCLPALSIANNGCARYTSNSSINQANELAQLEQAPRKPPPPSAPASIQNEMKILRFSGYDWSVKRSDENRVGPGPNYFSDQMDNVMVDAQGRLHLRITQRAGRWYCAEVISVRSFGYGTYRFYLDSNVDDIDPMIVAGLFTWSDDKAYHHRELDVEISRWGKTDNNNGQFVVQPYTNPPNISRFQIPPGVNATTHSFVWKAESVFFQSLRSLNADSFTNGSIIQQHTFTQDIPKPGDENVRINLWLFSGHAPTDGNEAEIIVSKFEFLPPS
jgi:hypothetical protein